jgi:hypothetical protein
LQLLGPPIGEFKSCNDAAKSKIKGGTTMDKELMLDVGQANELKLAFRRAGYTNAEIKKLCEGDLLAQLLPLVKGVAEVKTKPASKPVPLLWPIGTVTVPATGKLVAREKFVKDMSRKAAVKISYLGDNFSEWFLGKVEEPCPETTLRYAKLNRYSVDGPILAELGNTAETTLAQIYALMERQPNGEDGVLLTNGYANIFYVRDINGALRAVYMGWKAGGWDVYAFSVADPFGWFGGISVFSCNS